LTVDERPSTAVAAEISRLQGQRTSTIYATTAARNSNTLQGKQQKVSGVDNSYRLSVATPGNPAERPNRTNSVRSTNSTPYEMASVKDLSLSDPAIVSPNISVKEKAAFFSSPSPREGRVSWKPSNYSARSLEDEGDIPMQTRSSPCKVNTTSSLGMLSRNIPTGKDVFDRNSKSSTDIYGSRSHSTNETLSHSVFRGNQPVFDKIDSAKSSGNISVQSQSGRQRRNVNMSQMGATRSVRPVSERREL
jgi:hypothetical protein